MPGLPALIGGSDRNVADEGHLRVTLHHNLWEDCAERTPAPARGCRRSTATPPEASGVARAGIPGTRDGKIPVSGHLDANRAPFRLTLIPGSRWTKSPRFAP
jgi:hypothetical protein